MELQLDNQLVEQLDNNAVLEKLSVSTDTGL